MCEVNCQQCLDCHKIRFTDSDNIWGVWQVANPAQSHFVQDAQKVVCGTCQRKKNADLRQQKGSGLF